MTSQSPGNSIGLYRPGYSGAMSAGGFVDSLAKRQKEIDESGIENTWLFWLR